MKRITTRSFPDLRTWRRYQKRTDGRHWSQREAADFLGISQTYYRRLECGVQVARGKRAKRFTEQTGVPLEILVGAA